MADHVGVGEVDDDDVEGGVVDGFDDGVGDAGGGHLRGEVVGGDLLRGDQKAVFAGERLLDAAVEEVGYVGVLLCLGHAEVAEVGIGHDVGEKVVHRLGWDDQRQIEVFVVPGHADVVDVVWCLGAWDFEFEFGSLWQVICVVGGEAAGNIGVAGEDSGDLADAVGAVVEVDDDVAVADEAGFETGEGRDELVGDAIAVELADAVDWVSVDSAFGVAGDHGVEGLTLLLPAEVAVHGVVAARDGGDSAYAVLAEALFEGFDIVEAAGGHGVAAIHEGVDVDAGEFVLRC